MFVFFSSARSAALMEAVGGEAGDGHEWRAGCQRKVGHDPLPGVKNSVGRLRESKDLPIRSVQNSVRAGRERGCAGTEVGDGISGDRDGIGVLCLLIFVNKMRLSGLLTRKQSSQPEES